MFLNLKRSYKTNLKSPSQFTEMLISAVVSFEHHGTQKGGDLSSVPECGVGCSSSEVLEITGWLESHVFTPLQHPTGF